MTKTELTELIDSWENLQFLGNEIAANDEHYNLLMEVALYDSTPKSWRAAYLVDKINDGRPGLLMPFLDKMIDQVIAEKNHSKKRHFLKLISMNGLTEAQQGKMFDFCIGTLTSEKETVAVRAHAMQILHNIAVKEPELISEVVLMIENELDKHPTAGIKSRGTKLVGNLRKISNKN
jgi:hypothetical protein